MEADIYNRNPQDPNYKEGLLELEDQLERFKQQIEGCLFTPKTSVLGDVDFGASLDEYIWSFQSSNADLNYVVNQQIETYCSGASIFSYRVDTKFYAGTVRDIAVISIEIDNTDPFEVIVA